MTLRFIIVWEPLHVLLRTLNSNVHKDPSSGVSVCVLVLRRQREWVCRESEGPKHQPGIQGALPEGFLVCRDKEASFSSALPYCFPNYRSP